MGVVLQVSSTNERTGHQNLVCSEEPRELRGFRAFGNIWLLDLDHRSGGGGSDLADSIYHVARELEKRAGVRRLIAFEHNRLASIASLANVRIDFDGTPARDAAPLSG